MQEVRSKPAPAAQCVTDRHLLQLKTCSAIGIVMTFEHSQLVELRTTTFCSQLERHEPAKSMWNGRNEALLNNHLGHLLVNNPLRFC